MNTWGLGIPRTLDGSPGCVKLDLILKVLSPLYLVAVDQRNMGMSMKVEKSTVDQVKQRFEFNKKKKEEVKKQYGKTRSTTLPPLLK